MAALTDAQDGRAVVPVLTAQLVIDAPFTDKVVGVTDIKDPTVAFVPVAPE